MGDKTAGYFGTMDLTRWLDEHEVPWLPVNIRVSNGKKHILTFTQLESVGYKPKKADLRQNRTEHLKNEILRTCRPNAIMHLTSPELPVFDVDYGSEKTDGTMQPATLVDEDAQSENELLHYKSLTKGLPHFLCEPIEQKRHCVHIPDEGDILAGHLAFAPIDAKIYGERKAVIPQHKLESKRKRDQQEATEIDFENDPPSHDEILQRVQDLVAEEKVQGHFQMKLIQALVDIGIDDADIENLLEESPYTTLVREQIAQAKESNRLQNHLTFSHPYSALAQWLNFTSQSKVPKSAARNELLRQILFYDTKLKSPVLVDPTGDLRHFNQANIKSQAGLPNQLAGWNVSPNEAEEFIRNNALAWCRVDWVPPPLSSFKEHENTVNAWQQPWFLKHIDEVSYTYSVDFPVPVQPIDTHDAHDISSFLQIIWHNHACCDPYKFEWLLTYFGQILLEPGLTCQPNYIIVFYGPEGTGKSMLAEKLMEKLFYREGLYGNCPDPTEYCKDKDAAKQPGGKLVFNISEVEDMTKKIWGQIKATTTAERLHLRGFHEANKLLINCCRQFITTNKVDVIKRVAGADGRRVLWWYVQPVYVGEDTNYEDTTQESESRRHFRAFDELRTDTNGGLLAIAKFLRDVAMSKQFSEYLARSSFLAHPPFDCIMERREHQESDAMNLRIVEECFNNSERLVNNENRHLRDWETEQSRLQRLLSGQCEDYTYAEMGAREFQRDVVDVVAQMDAKDVGEDVQQAAQKTSITSQRQMLKFMGEVCTTAACEQLAYCLGTQRSTLRPFIFGSGSVKIANRHRVKTIFVRWYLVRLLLAAQRAE